ncbi:hypothetical protein HBH70_011860 [Parastagonospora nodorum]|nr:hypothetical protein HBH70_011860 [Parastagonospora nodorum]
MLQTNIREGYRIITLEVVKLIEDLISYLAVAKCTQLRNAQIPKVFYKAYSTKVKIEDLSNTLTLTLSKIAQQQSLSVVSNRSTALITNKFGVASLTEPAILNNANVALVDAVHHSVVIDALIMTLIKDDDDLLGTVNSYIKLRRLRRCKTKAADSRYAKASRGRTKKDKDLEDSNTSSDVPCLRRRNRAAAYSLLDSDDYCSDSSLDIDSKDDSEDEEATIAKNLLTDAYILYFKELLSDNSGIFANAIGIGKTRAIVLAVLIGHCDLSDLLALRFCFFSDSPPENISRLTKEEAIEMRIDTTNAISKALAAANKLVALQSYIIPEANTPAVHSKATKHCSALLAARFIIVCGFRKVDKHVFRAYNTISVIAQRTIIRKGSPYVEKRAILLPSYITVSNWFNATNKRDSVTSDRIYKIEDAVIASYSALATLKAAQFKIYGSCKVKRFTLNSVKDLFTNLSKDYFLSIAAEDAAKAANTLLLLKEVCAKILIELYKLIVQAVTWLGLREKFSNESVLVMQGALIAFAEVIILTEATHVVIIEPQDRQNTQDQFIF